MPQKEIQKAHLFTDKTAQFHYILKSPQNHKIRPLSFVTLLNPLNGPTTLNKPAIPAALLNLSDHLK